jgi:hypothetical protein
VKNVDHTKILWYIEFSGEDKEIGRRRNLVTMFCFSSTFRNIIIIRPL